MVQMCIILINDWQLRVKPYGVILLLDLNLFKNLMTKIIYVRIK